MHGADEEMAQQINLVCIALHSAKLCGGAAIAAARTDTISLEQESSFEETKRLL